MLTARRIAVVLVGAGTFGLGAPQGASAGTYSVWACANGSEASLSRGAWTPFVTGADTTANTTCAPTTARGVGSLSARVLSSPANPAGSTPAAGWTIAAAPGTAIAGLDVWWVNAAQPGPPAGRIEILAPGPVATRTASQFGTTFPSPFGDASRQSIAGLAAGQATLRASCVSACEAAPAPSAQFDAFRLRAIVQDPSAPTGAAAGLAEGAVVSTPSTVSVRAADQGSGVHGFALVVDGREVQRVATGGARCADVDPATADPYEYAAMDPCPAEGSAALTVDPAALGGGRHAVAAVAIDASGNRATLASWSVVVAPAALDGPRPPGLYDPARGLFFNPDADLGRPRRPNGANAGPARVRLAFAVRRRGTRRFVGQRLVGFTDRPLFRGRLTALSGRPIQGARVWRAVSVTRGRWRISGRPLVTSRTGTIVARMPSRAPSRRVSLVYFPFTDSNQSSRSPVRRLSVRAPVSLRFGRSRVPVGGRLRVIARLRTRVAVGRSVLGTLQLRDEGRWRTFRQLRFTSRRDTVRTAVRFRQTRSGTTYRFRLRVPRQTTLRFATGISRSRRVRIGG